MVNVGTILVLPGIAVVQYLLRVASAYVASVSVWFCEPFSFLLRGNPFFRKNHTATLASQSKVDSVESSSTVTPDRGEVGTVQSHFRRRTLWGAVKAEHFFRVRKLDLFLKLWSRKKPCLPVRVQFVMKRWPDFR